MIILFDHIPKRNFMVNRTHASFNRIILIFSKQCRSEGELTGWPFEALFVSQGYCPHIWELCFQEPIHPSCKRETRVLEKLSHQKQTSSLIHRVQHKQTMSTAWQTERCIQTKQLTFCSIRCNEWSILSAYPLCWSLHTAKEEHTQTRANHWIGLGFIWLLIIKT